MSTLHTIQNVGRGKLSDLWLDRELSLLAFNARVLTLSERGDIPLLERLRYLTIVSSNLDEFFEVRAALVEPTNAHGQHVPSYAKAAHELVERQYKILNQHLMPELAGQGVDLVSHGDRTAEQKAWVKQLFEREIKPLLLPVVLDPSHPFPQVANKSLNFIVKLSGEDAFGRSNRIGIVKVTRNLQRYYRFPARLSPSGRMQFVSISSIIRSHLRDLFAGREVSDFSQFRVTRHSDLSVDEDDVKNLRTALQQGLVHRNYGQAMRLEVSYGCTEELASLLMAQFNLAEHALYRVHGPVNLVRLSRLIELVDQPRWLYPSHAAAYPPALKNAESLFTQIRKGDVLIHQPFEQFDALIDLLKEAVNDPHVLAIKQTIYRTGSDSRLMELLQEAVTRGKEVTVVVELKARFDEEANINWSQRLEQVGAQVVYGVVGLKTHAKLMLISRREGANIRRYAHLSTGNYNPRTARLYTDLSMLTVDPKITADIEAVFNLLANQTKLPRLNKLIAAPFHLQRQLIAHIQSTAQAARSGLDARMVLKMNALTDEKLMSALVQASQDGVKIDLLVRGACMLPAQVKGFTDNVRVRSIVGRFLEHSRVFYFRANGVETLWLSSADWMNRNMLRRIEIAWPVEDPQLRQRIIDECLVAYLHDTADAWDMQKDGHYLSVRHLHRKPAKGSSQAHRHSAQLALMARHPFLA